MHKLGGRRALSFPHFRKETLNLAAGSGGAAYRIRTYDPRITNARTGFNLLILRVDLAILLVFDNQSDHNKTGLIY